MRVGIYVRLCNEENLIEWMDYHYKCGFDYILFYDDHSEPSVKSVIENYGKFDSNKYYILDKLFPKIGTVFPSPGICPIIFKNTILPIIQNNMDYVFFIDMDEYFYMDKYTKVTDLIRSYDDFDLLYIYWKYFGTQEKKINDNSRLIKNYIYSRFNTSNCGKSLCKVSSILTMGNPHIFKLKENKKKIIDIYNNKFNCESDLLKKNNFKKIQSNNIYLAHYYFLDILNFLNRRFFSLPQTNRLIGGGEVYRFSFKYKNELEKYRENKKELIDKIFSYKDKYKSYNFECSNIDFETHLSQLYWSFCIHLKKKNTDLVNFYET